MTALRDTLLARIARTGPMTVADYMAECLLNPRHGYYATRDPLGTAGDFTTAPEISQMFGELVGLALAQAWLDQGAPAPPALVELGPGRGTLMADIRRATRTVPGLPGAAIHLVEASPVLRQAQAQRLSPETPRWHDSVQSLPEGPLLVVANEFFDALPIRQYLRDGPGWRERMVSADGARLIFAAGPQMAVPDLAARLEHTAQGQIVERCGAAAPIMGELARRIATYGGAMVVIDYGGWDSLGDTLQAVAAHRPVDPLTTPGAADLTAHVDFAALAAAARQASPRIAASAMVPQGVFLERLGIAARAERLARALSGAALQSHLAAYRRLTHPEEMGSLFKCMGFTPSSQPPIPGLAP